MAKTTVREAPPAIYVIETGIELRIFTNLREVCRYVADDLSTAHRRAFKPYTNPHSLTVKRVLRYTVEGNGADLTDQVFAAIEKAHDVAGHAPDGREEERVWRKQAVSIIEGELTK